MSKKLLVLLACMPGMISFAQPKNQKPNIVFIMADDLGYGDIAPYGQQKIHTPNITRLANEGMKFTQFYAGTSVCAPSRASLMTGLHTGHTFIRGNKEVDPEGQQPLPDNSFTLGKLVQQAGYTTGVFGKWGLGPVGSSGDPLRQGFDAFYGYNCQLLAHRYYPTHLWDNDKRVDLPGNENLQAPAVYAEDLIQQKALAFISEHRQAPFALFLTYTLPHAELLVPDDSILQSYKNKFPEQAYNGNDYGPRAKKGGYTSQALPHATFAAMVSRLDAYVGEVMALLKQLDLDNNTLVIFTSDNGPHVEGGADPAFFNSAGGLRGVKRDLYEGGIREPFIARWPGKIKPGSTSGFVGAFWDIMPTLAAITGAKLAGPTDGISFLPELTGKKQVTHKYLYWEFHENGGRQAVRKGNWKAIRLNVFNESATTLELYDLATDPQEKNNLAAENPKLVKELTKIMESSHVESAIFPFHALKK